VEVAKSLAASLNLNNQQTNFLFRIAIDPEKTRCGSPQPMSPAILAGEKDSRCAWAESEEGAIESSGVMLIYVRDVTYVYA